MINNYKAGKSPTKEHIKLNVNGEIISETGGR